MSNKYIEVDDILLTFIIRYGMEALQKDVENDAFKKCAEATANKILDHLSNEGRTGEVEKCQLDIRVNGLFRKGYTNE